MKKIVILTFILSIFFCTSANAEMQLKATVYGMSCNSCVQSIRSEVMKIDGIKEVEVDLKNKTVRVAYENSSTFDEDIFRSTVKEAGYEFVKLIDNSSQTETETE